MWQTLEEHTKTFQKLGLEKAVDFEKFNRIAIVHHSSAIEGSRLSFEETSLLITEGITAKGKSMSEHQMVNDHYHALLFCMDEAQRQTAINPKLLKDINALVNKNTGQIRNTTLGVCNDTRGDYRLGNVTAGTTYFVNYDKISAMVENLCNELQSKINEVKTICEIYQFSFDAHYYLVSIHPWFDGNGRTSRLLMNYIQAYHRLPLSIVFIEDKSAYIQSLNEARKNNNLELFRNFMCEQQVKFLKQEMEKYNQRNEGFSFVL